MTHPSKKATSKSPSDDKENVATLQTEKNPEWCDHLLTILSHEIRNPLAAISFSLDCLKDTESLSENGNRLIEMTARQTEFIAAILANLQAVNDLKSHEFKFRGERFDLNSIIPDAVHSVHPAIAKNEQTLHMALAESPLWVQGEPVRMKQAIVNLLVNSSKYTPAGGEIWLETESRDGQVTFIVRDTGRGIEHSDREKIFDLFFQPSVPQAKQKIERSQVSGVGIGLYLVDQIVRVHRGTVSVSSQGLNQGSQFTVSLPADESQK